MTTEKMTADQMTVEQLNEYVNGVEKGLSKLHTVKIQAETQLSALRRSASEIKADLKAEGFNPDNLDAELKERQEKLMASVNELQELLPENLLNKYQALTPEDLADVEALAELDLDKEF